MVSFYFASRYPSSNQRNSDGSLLRTFRKRVKTIQRAKKAKTIKSNIFTRINREKSNIAIAIIRNYKIVKIKIILFLGAPILFTPSKVSGEVG